MSGAKKPLGTIVLEGAKLDKYPPNKFGKKTGFLFGVRPKAYKGRGLTKGYTFRAGSEEERNGWLNCFLANGGYFGAEEETETFFEGWLEIVNMRAKLNASLTKRRFCVLKSLSLLCKESNEKNAKCARTIPILQETTISRVGELGFVINSLGKAKEFKAASYIEREEWVAAVEKRVKAAADSAHDLDIPDVPDAEADAEEDEDDEELTNSSDKVVPQVEEPSPGSTPAPQAHNHHSAPHHHHITPQSSPATTRSPRASPYDSPSGPRAESEETTPRAHHGRPKLDNLKIPASATSQSPNHSPSAQEARTAKLRTLLAKDFDGDLEQMEQALRILIAEKKQVRKEDESADEREPDNSPRPPPRSVATATSPRRAVVTEPERTRPRVFDAEALIGVKNYAVHIEVSIPLPLFLSFFLINGCMVGGGGETKSRARHEGLPRGD